MSFLPNSNQVLMLENIWKCHHRGIHVTVETLISTVSLWAVGHGFAYKWIEANDIATVTNDWLALQAANAVSVPPLYPPNVIIVSDIDVP
jgi:hypothetical protein